MSELHFQPIKGKAQEILKAILQTPEIASCSKRDVLVLRLACEEIVMNVTTYAYPDGTEGYMDVDIEKTADLIVISFKDGGKPFNPLEQKKPDTNLSWMQRRIGGLGIFLVTKKMDDIYYAYVNNQNVLTIERLIKHKNI
jgi:anti-sigma regulatory factor (Ser/Thr protein kinase)